MAKAEMKMPDEFLEKLSTLGSRTDEIAAKVLKAGGEIVLAKVKSNLSSSIGNGNKYPSRSTGQLQHAIGLSPARVDRNGNYDVKIGFAEPRRDGGSNAKLANILEYGKHGQPARPFLASAESASRSACIEKMISTLKEEINKA